MINLFTYEIGDYLETTNIVSNLRIVYQTKQYIEKKTSILANISFFLISYYNNNNHL